MVEKQKKIFELKKSFCKNAFRNKEEYVIYSFALVFTLYVCTFFGALKKWWSFLAIKLKRMLFSLSFY